MLAETSFLIDLLRGEQEAVIFIEKNVVPVLYTTEICVFELIVGAYALREKPEKEMQRINTLLSRMVVLGVDRKAVMKAGEIAGTLIKQGKAIEDADCLIAGIALSNGVHEIITRNKEHYERIPGVKVREY